MTDARTLTIDDDSACTLGLFITYQVVSMLQVDRSCTRYSTTDSIQTMHTWDAEVPVQELKT